MMMMMMNKRNYKFCQQWKLHYKVKTSHWKLHSNNFSRCMRSSVNQTGICTFISTKNRRVSEWFIWLEIFWFVHDKWWRWYEWSSWRRTQPCATRLAPLHAQLRNTSSLIRFRFAAKQKTPRLPHAHISQKKHFSFQWRSMKFIARQTSFQWMDTRNCVVNLCSFFFLPSFNLHC